MEYSTSEYSTFHLFVTVALGRGGGRAPPNSPVEFMRIIPRWNIPHKFHCDFFLEYSTLEYAVCCSAIIYAEYFFLCYMCGAKNLSTLEYSTLEYSTSVEFSWNIPLRNIPLILQYSTLEYSTLIPLGAFGLWGGFGTCTFRDWNIPC